MTSNSETKVAAEQLVDKVAKRLNHIRLDYVLRDRADGPYLVFEVTLPGDRFFRALQGAQADLPDEHLFKSRATILKRQKAQASRVLLPEAKVLRAALSESLTVDQHTFEEDFFSRYTKSVFGYEDQILADSNYLVYGRRGSGKSSLLAYAMHHRRLESRPYAWVSMQAYSGRDDRLVSVSVARATLEQLSRFAEHDAEFNGILVHLRELESGDEKSAVKAFPRVLPRLGELFARLTARHGTVAIFIDDVHVISSAYQPLLLNDLYSFTRGNRTHLKVSGIEQFTRAWDAEKKRGLEAPNDAQVLKLDYNLTMPDKSFAHISSILDSHAQACGLPGASYISGDGVLERLVWVAAAVPRDALNLFAQAITKAISHDQKRVSITSVNAAASEMAEEKLGYIERDAGAKLADARAVLEELKTFCISEQRTNAFLLEIKNDNPNFRFVQDLIALRLVHVLHEGITPHVAGRRYQALMLDYGFYVGIRAAKSVDLFQKDPKAPSVKELRRLPVIQFDKPNKSGRIARARQSV
jgi:Cdc6-like AAA superfamily ATPase